MASTGCRKTAFYVGIGCLVVPIGLAILVAAVLWAARSAQKTHGPWNPQATTLTIPVGPAEAGGPGPSSGAEPGAGAAAPGAAPGGEAAGPVVVPGRDLEEIARAAGASYRPLRLKIDMQEGRFIVLPAPPGSDIKIDGAFDPRDYELTQEAEDLGEAGREVTIRFRRKGFLFLFFNPEPKNELTIQIPQGVPTALDLHFSKCESNVDLGGLHLTALDADLSMGQHKLAFGRPVAESLPRVRFRTGMGEIRLIQLGNARAKEYYVRGSMGELRADFEGEWEQGFQSRAEIRFSMGNVRVEIPEGVRIAKTSVTRVGLGDARTKGLDEEPEDPNAPVLELDVSARMGEIRVVRQ